MRKSTVLIRNGLLLLACIVVFMFVAMMISNNLG